MLSCAVRGTVDLGGFLPSLFFFRNGIMGVISFHKQCIVIAGLVRTHLRANKARLKVVPQDLFSRLTVLLIARKNMGSMTAIMPRVAPELPAVSRRTKNSGTPTTAAAPKQISCRAVRLKATLDFTLLKSRGTEI